MTQDPGSRSSEHSRPDLDWQQIANALWLTVVRAEADRETGRPALRRAPDPPWSSPADAEDEEPESEGELVLPAPRQATVAVLHVLTQGLWYHTGLTPERVRVRVPEPGAPNGTWQRPDGAPWPGGEPPVPVLELEARWLHRWAQLVTRPSARGRDTLALLPGVPAERWEREPEPTARERVFRFRATASPSAFKLASRLAAAPLNIPVMEFVQGTHEPQGVADPARAPGHRAAAALHARPGAGLQGALRALPGGRAHLPRARAGAPGARPVGRSIGTPRRTS
ncbi:hypothetical protein ACFV1F_38870 [Streptomyces sp. NPDC059590]|uniref:hypothetical protein n=1 Tax=Streptomyces sp. NPDC059590 TaxID=3346877 RepID=UPI00368B471A